MEELGERSTRSFIIQETIGTGKTRASRALRKTSRRIRRREREKEVAREEIGMTGWSAGPDT